VTQPHVRIAVYNDTEKRPLHDCAEIWFRGYGSWWTDDTGKFTIEARLRSVTPTEVTLEKTDGSRVKISRDRLSTADQEHLREFLRRSK
jgi:hypothetical protein